MPATDPSLIRGTTCHWLRLIPSLPGSYRAHARHCLPRQLFSARLGHGGPANSPDRIRSGPAPQIVATAKDRQVLHLFNQEYWQIDSLDLSGSNTYGIFVSGDRGTLHHIYLENLFVTMSRAAR